MTSPTSIRASHRSFGVRRQNRGCLSKYNASVPLGSVTSARWKASRRSSTIIHGTPRDSPMRSAAVVFPAAECPPIRNTSQSLSLCVLVASCDRSLPGGSRRSAYRQAITEAHSAKLPHQLLPPPVTLPRRELPDLVLGVEALCGPDQLRIGLANAPDDSGVVLQAPQHEAHAV